MTTTDQRGLTALQEWEQLVPAHLKRDPRNQPELMEFAVKAAQEHVAYEVQHGRLSGSITTWMVEHGMTRPAAQQVAMVCAERAREPGALVNLLEACDMVFQDCGMDAKGVDNATRVAILKLKAQLQGALAPKQSETKVTISVADELAKRTKAIRERKDAQARVVADPVHNGAQRLVSKVLESRDE